MKKKLFHSDSRRLTAVILSLLVLLGVVSVTVRGLYSGMPSSASELGDWLNGLVRSDLRQIDVLEQLAPSVMLMGGAKEQDGIFITGEYLLENITAPADDRVLEENIAGVERFLESNRGRAALALIPTAVAIKQQNIPVNADLYNQKVLIDGAYQRLSGKVSTVDTYTPLFAAKDEYIYYRTASNLTGLGGYYVYSAITQRLGLSTRSLDQFEIEHLATRYYGDLYERSSYKGVSPDLLTLYRFTRNEREYKLTVRSNGEPRTYYELFPTHLEALGKPEEVLLGGAPDRIELSVASPYDNSILIFADETVAAYLPFLSVHYQQITVIDPSRVTPEEISALDTGDYDRILFVCSVKTILEREFTSRLPDDSAE